MAALSSAAAAASSAADVLASLPAPLVEAVVASQKRTLDMFYASNQHTLPDFPKAARMRVAVKMLDDYPQQAVPERFAAKSASGPGGAAAPAAKAAAAAAGPLLLLTDAAPGRPASSSSAAAASSEPASRAGASAAGAASTALVVHGTTGGGVAAAVSSVVDALARRQQPKGVEASSLDEYAKAEALTAKVQAQSRAIVARRAPPKVPQPGWHAPWKLMRVIAGHLGWVRCLAVEPGNEWFASGAGDNTIKVWDLASGTLRVTLTGHISPVRSLTVSARHPYLFSGGEDKLVKCWDLEANKAVRHYHGHTAGVYAVALHPSVDVLATAGRDAAVRLWDVRTRAPVHTLTGHTDSVAALLTNGVEPQVISSSMDATVRCWDMVAGKVRTVLTHHKKAVRCLAAHAREFAFVSGSSDHLKKWALPEGTFVHNYTGHASIINALAINADDVLVSGGDDGSLRFWDYRTGYAFQEVQSRVQPGSLDAEAGIYAMAFDNSGSRLLTAEADKSIKVWREDPDASPESHPINMEAWTEYCREHKRY